jgi:GTPase Era involved in 16S rRNA processing
VQSARGAIGEVDVVLLLVDGSQPAGRGDAFIVELLRHCRVPVHIALNKCDQVDPARAEDLAASYRELLLTRPAAASDGWPQSSEPSPQPPGEPAGPGDRPEAAAADVRSGAFSDTAPGPATAAELAATDQTGASGETVAADAKAASRGLARIEAGTDRTGPWPAADRQDSGGVSGAAGLLAWPLHPLSALTGEGCAELVAALAADLPQGPHLYPADSISDQPEQLLLAELIREQVLHQTREEVPHSVAVQIDRIVDDGPRTAVLATVLVERSSQKGILIGKGGQMLREIGRGARLQMQKVFDGPVYLELFVKVVPGWRSHPGRLAELGYRGD